MTDWTPPEPPAEWTPPPVQANVASPPSYGPPVYNGPPSYTDPPAYEPSYGQAWPAPTSGESDITWLSQTPGGAAPIPPATAPRRRRGLVVGALLVAVVLGGGATTYVAVSQNRAGSSSPEAAVRSIVRDFDNTDLLGLLAHVAPGERRAILGPLEEQASDLARLHQGGSTAGLSKVRGISLSIDQLGFAGTESVNDHETIVKIDSGTITYNLDLARLSLFSSAFGRLTSPLPTAGGSGRGTVNLADQVRRTGEPIRVATQKVSGRWYPSLIYTIADNATHSAGLANPARSDAIAPHGDASAQSAVEDAVKALSMGNYRRAIELASPDEMAALHDYGGLIVKNMSNRPTDRDVISDLTTGAVAVKDGVRVTLKSMTVDTSRGDRIVVAFDGLCLAVTLDGETRRFCAVDAVNLIDETLSFSGKSTLTGEERASLTRALNTVPQLGVIATRSGGRWYVNPTRSLFSLSEPMYAGLQGNDLTILLRAITSRQ